jgi:hypothetical protein
VPWMVGFARVQAGNPLGYQLARMRRGRSLLREAHLVIRWRRRGLPYHLPRLANFLKRNQVALVKRIAQRATRPMKRRGPLSNFSATLANLGSHREHRRLEDMCDWASITLPGPVPTLTALQVRGCLAIELCYPTGLCDHEAVLKLTAELPGALEAGPSVS